MILAFQDEIECHRLELMHAAPLMYLRDLISVQDKIVLFNMYLLMRCKIIQQRC